MPEIDTSTTCTVRTKLKMVLWAYPEIPGMEEDVYRLAGGRVVTVTTTKGRRLAYEGPEGSMVIQEDLNGDISVTSCSNLDRVEGVSRNCGTLQGIDCLPKALEDVLDKLVICYQVN